MRRLHGPAKFGFGLDRLDRLSPLVGRRDGADPIPLDDQIIAMITGEGSYYRVSDLDTLFLDRSQTASTPAVVDGLVGTIKDKGPNARHLVAAADDVRATLRFTDGIYYLEQPDVAASNWYVSEILAASVAPPQYLASGIRKPVAGIFAGLSRYESSTSYFSVQSTAASALVANTRYGGTIRSASRAATDVSAWSVIDGLRNATSINVGKGGDAWTTTAFAPDVTAMTGRITFGRPDAGVGDAGHFVGGVWLGREPTTGERATIVLALTGMYDPGVLEDLGLVLE